MAKTPTVKIGVQPHVQVGFASKAGGLLTLIATLGTIAAAITANDTATIVSGAGAALVALATLGGRFAQAVVIARLVARAALPVVAELAQEDPPDRPASS